MRNIWGKKIRGNIVKNNADIKYEILDKSVIYIGVMAEIMSRTGFFEREIRERVTEKT